MADSPYNSAALVYSLADAVAQNSDVKGKLYSRILDAGATTVDDFAKFEGAADSKAIFWKKRDLAAGGGDKVVFATIGDAGGPGVRGEKELTGNTSRPRMGAYTCQVDSWADAVELTKKQLWALATGKSIESVVLGMLSKKLGRQRMYDMMHCLKRTPNATFLRPNSRTSRDAITPTDTLTPSFLITGKARLQGRGGRPVEIKKSKSGSPVNSYLAFIGQDAMTAIRDSTSYQNALQLAADRGDDNPMFSGRLVDWQSMLLWEHIVVDLDADDAIGSPIAPKAILGTAVTAANTTFILKSGTDGTNTLPQYFRDFKGYDYLFTEDQIAAPDAGTYYFWIYNTSGGSEGKAGFYSYTGSDNTGNQIIAMQGRLRASASGIAVTTLGNVVWDASTMTDSHPVGSWIIPANANGVPIAENFIFGAGAAMRAYGVIEAEPIVQERDYKRVKGMGYEGIWGQRACLDTQSVPRHFVVLQTAFEHPGIPVPSVV